MRLQLCSLALLFLSLAACQEEQKYSLEELSKNTFNQLELPVAEKMEREDYLKLFETFQEFSVEAIKTHLTNQPINLQEASFGFYYLANAYAKENQLEQALLYHEIAAKQYFNPQSYLKLAEREYFVTKDFKQAFHYLHHALEISLEITDNNRSHPIAQNIRNKSQFLLQELEQLATKGAFDRTATWNALKEVMTEKIERFRKMYHLKGTPVQ
ncbi:MAG: hypothetical protein ACRBFS_05080 [Aureispira sp.]